LIPPNVLYVYGHQEEAIRAIHHKKTTLVSTGTGSGKTECFLYPIISHCLHLRDQNAPSGISAVLVYPMNALAEDQLDRLRSLLAGSNIPFAMYVGKTPETDSDVSGHRMPANSSNADYAATLAKFRSEGRSDSVHPAEEVCSREMMRTPGKQPRILLTNVKQLELLLTRRQDVELFADARLDFMVFDEAHTFSGIQGAETACLIRRLRTFCGKASSHTTCIATSATIVDQNEPNAARNFASRFFGVAPTSVVTVHEKYQKETWSRSSVPKPPESESMPELLKQTLAGLESDNVPTAVAQSYAALTGSPLAVSSQSSDGWQESLYDALQSNQIAANIATALHNPRKLANLMSDLELTSGRHVSEEEMLVYLALGAVAVKNNRPLMRPVAHTFIRGISGGVVSFPQGNTPKVWLTSADELTQLQDNAKVWKPRLFTCTTCGQHYFLTFLKDFDYSGKAPQGGELSDQGHLYWEALDETNGGKRVVLLDKLVSQDEEQTDSQPRTAPISICRHCGTGHPPGAALCCGCGSSSEQVRLFAVRTSDKQPGYLSSCISCGARGKNMGRRFREPMRELRATHVSDVHVLAQDMIQHADRKRLLLFTDNRQRCPFASSHSRGLAIRLQGRDRGTACQ
jgi:ribosomal protein L40E